MIGRREEEQEKKRDGKKERKKKNNKKKKNIWKKRVLICFQFRHNQIHNYCGGGGVVVGVVGIESLIVFSKKEKEVKGKGERMVRCVFGVFASIFLSVPSPAPAPVPELVFIFFVGIFLFSFFSFFFVLVILFC